jgi:hypothetical protein
LIARSAVWASYRKRREVIIGWPALQAIWGNKMLPALADWYLARNGYEGQMAAAEASAQRPDNLWHSPGGDAGAHGKFGAEARSGSVQHWLDRHRAGLGLAFLGAIGALAAHRLKSSGRLRRLTDKIGW